MTSIELIRAYLSEHKEMLETTFKMEEELPVEDATQAFDNLFRLYPEAAAEIVDGSMTQLKLHEMFVLVGSVVTQEQWDETTTDEIEEVIDFFLPLAQQLVDNA